MEEIIDLENVNFIDELFGDYDQNIILLKKECLVDVIIRDGKLKISGEKENIFVAKKVIEYILKNTSKGDFLTKQNIKFIIECFKKNELDKVLDSFKEQICTNFQKKPIVTQTFAQKQYLNSIKNNIVTFGVGVAGTGKTYIAVAKAVSDFKEKLVEKIVLTRPVVEAGERLGFLPGDFQSKIDPYLRPLYDIMEDIIGVENLNKFLERKKIEIVPLAYMRGRTLSKSFIILDEAQNTTSTQMKMFLTRLGSGSKMVITGDLTQIDLFDTNKSGLLKAVNILNNIKDIAIIKFKRQDIVRHELVQKIIDAYGGVFNKETEIDG